MAEDVRGEGVPEPVIDGAGLRIAVVAARFNSHITLRLLDGARRGLAGAGVRDEDVDVVWVPGAFEIPLAARALASRYDAVICLGCVIRGETAHFEHVAGQAAAGIMRVGLDTGTPVVFGVLTTENLEQALARSVPEHGAHNVGEEGAAVAVEMVRLLQGGTDPPRPGLSGPAPTD
jgi:6,7-dimethyl-8-ribityllumazine synthase